MSQHGVTITFSTLRRVHYVIYFAISATIVGFVGEKKLSDPLNSSLEQVGDNLVLDLAEGDLCMRLASRYFLS